MAMEMPAGSQQEAMAQTYLRGTAAAVHRVDLPCEQTGFACPPPFDVHIKFLPNAPPGQGWTLLAHAAAGAPDALARWLAKDPRIAEVRVGPGLAPKLLRATVRALPPLWEAAASFVKVHHLDLAADGSAAWFIEGDRQRVAAFVQDLERRQRVPLAATEVRCRPVHERDDKAPISRRQFEVLSMAVAMGYYDIPHRLDLRALAARAGISLGSLSELLRRAEAAVLTHYVDAALMAWPADDDGPPNPFKPFEELLRPVLATRPNNRPPRPLSVPHGSAAWPPARF